MVIHLIRVWSQQPPCNIAINFLMSRQPINSDNKSGFLTRQNHSFISRHFFLWIGSDNMFLIRFWITSKYFDIFSWDENLLLIHNYSVVTDLGKLTYCFLWIFIQILVFIICKFGINVLMCIKCWNAKCRNVAIFQVLYVFHLYLYPSRRKRLDHKTKTD